jgi:hypothetical protein
MGMGHGIKEKTIISASTLFTSLLAYWYAKENQKDGVPFVMFGAFVGSIIGETIIESIKKKDNGV